MTRRPKIAISLGDPCGIGPELLLGSLAVIHSWAEVTVVGASAGVDLLTDLPGARVAWRWVEPPQGAARDLLGPGLRASGLRNRGAA